MPNISINDPTRPTYVVRSAAAAYEWLRVELGTGPLADVRHGISHLSCPRVAHQLDGGQLAAIVQARYRCTRPNGEPALFPLAAARLAVRNPGGCPNVRHYGTGQTFAQMGRAA